MDKSEYNSEPVFYCKSCLSLKVKTVAADMDLDYCDECGSTDISQASIGEWEALYKERYGFDYLHNKLK